MAIGVAAFAGVGSTENVHDASMAMQGIKDILKGDSNRLINQTFEVGEENYGKGYRSGKEVLDAIGPSVKRKPQNPRMQTVD